MKKLMKTLMIRVRWLAILALGIGLAASPAQVGLANASSAACAGDVSALRTALVAANSSATATTIGLDSGCTYDFVDAPYSGTGPNALPVITTFNPIVINGNGAILALTNAASGRFFEVQTGASLTLNNLTLKDGGSKGSSVLTQGGAVLVDYNNSSDPNLFGFGTLDLNNVLFNGNKASLGGAIYSNGEVDATHSQVFASTSNGGAIYIHNGGLILFSSSIYDNTTTNKAAFGAGVVLTGLSVANIQSSSFVNNLSQGNYGGALTVLPSAAAILGGDYFEGNQAALGGGAIYSANASALVAGNSTFYNNTAAKGAALYAGPGSNINVANSTFTGNPASQLNGGSIFGSTAKITIKNSIVGGGSNGSDCAGAAFDPTSIANLDVTGGCGSSFSEYPLDQLGLGAPGFHGGWTKTVPVLQGPALTGGDPVTCATAPVNNVDQRGYPRGIDLSHPGTSTCTIGAYGHQNITFLPRVVR